MKLKTIVASLVALGLSGSVLAMQPYMMDPSFQRDVMRYQVNKLDMILDRNQPGGFDQPCGWTCRINISGWMNTDAYLANKPPVFLGLNPAFNLNDLNVENLPVLQPTSGRASDLILNNANLFVDARVNNWVTANMSVVYSSLSGIPGSTGPYNIANSLFVYHPLNRTSIDTAYATIGNFQASPIYFRVGKEYIPFGAYDPYGFVTQENPTQLFTEITATAAQLGFIIPNGLYGSVYTFAGNPKLSDGGSTRRIQNGGVDLGWGWRWFNSKFNLNAGYLANIADTNFLSSYYLNSLIEVTTVPGLPNEKAPAYDVNADVTFGPFDANGHYVATTRNFRKPILLGLPAAPPPETISSLTFKKPKLWGLEVGLTFPVVAHQSRLAIGYQGTTQLAGLLPKNRYYIDYMVNLAKWFDLGIAVFQDRDYSFSEENISVNDPEGGSLLLSSDGTGNKSTVGQLRASIKFA
ncbi:MAG: LbtU family siderophore porin [Gammaproteobacteria bacterium]|nr:MAG: LbtU family siderophore porin [Gammaproteobacteria bacterium]